MCPNSSSSSSSSSKSTYYSFKKTINEIGTTNGKATGIIRSVAAELPPSQYDSTTTKRKKNCKNSSMRLSCPPGTILRVQRESLGMPSYSQPNNTNRNSGTNTDHINNICKFLCASPLRQIPPPHPTPRREMLRLTFWVVNHIGFILKSHRRVQTVWVSQTYRHKSDHSTDQPPTSTSDDDKWQNSVNYLINKQVHIRQHFSPRTTTGSERWQFFCAPSEW
jgi:hypothetical protein